MAEIVSSSFVQPQNDHLAEETGAKTTAEAAALAEKLNNRMTKRHARLKEKWSADRQEEVGEAGSVNAAAKLFWDEFQSERQSIATETSILFETPKATPEENSLFLDSLTQRVLALHALISQHTHALPKYDVKRSLSEATETRNIIEKVRTKVKCKILYF